MSSFLKNTNTTFSSATINNPSQEGITYTGYISKDGNNFIKFKTKDTARSSGTANIIADDNTGTFTKVTALKKCNVSITANGNLGGNASFLVYHKNTAGTVIKYSYTFSSVGNANASINTPASVGDFFYIYNSTAVTDTVDTNFSITATAIDSATPSFMVSLPSSKENLFSVWYNSSTQTIVSKSSDFFTSITKIGTGHFSINFNSGFFTVAPVPVAISDNMNVITNTLSASSAEFTIYNPSLSPVDGNVQLHFHKQSPDYSPSGCFVGNVAKDWTYNLTVTGTNWTTSKARGTPYQTGDGTWHLKFNIHGVVTPTASSLTIAIAGITFQTGSSYQSLSAITDGNLPCGYALANDSSNTIIAAFTGATNGWFFHGDVELASKPSWAINS